MNIYNTYKERGWKTIRVAGPKQGGKRPLDKAWPDMPATLPEEGENCGIQTGEVSGFIVLDVDGPEGAESLATYESQHGALPEGPRQVTGSGGQHILFEYPAEKLGNRVKFLPGLDVRSDGGQIVVAPSVHKNGNQYRWTGLESRVPSIPKNLLTLMGAEPVVVVDKSHKTWTKWLATQPPMVAGTGANTVFMTAIGIGVREHNVSDVDTAWDAFAAYNARATNKTGQPYPWARREFEKAFDKIRGEFLESDQSKVQFEGDDTHLIRLNRALREDPQFANSIRFNELRYRVEIDGKGLDDNQLYYLSAALQKRYSHAICKSGGIVIATLGGVVNSIAVDYAYDPLKEWAGALKWDGKNRLEHVAKRVLGVTDPISNTVITKWLIGCIARAMKPGCKFDNVLTLQGTQGAGKSTFFSALGGEYFSDSSIVLGSKDAYQNLAGVWIWEWAELEHVWRGKGTALVKNFITSQQDRFRLPYAGAPVTLPRRCVFAATSNEQDFLKDHTGSRRWWCIIVPGRIDTSYIKEHREQLWAEAAELYKQGGDGCWTLSEAETAAQSAINAQLSPEDVLASDVETVMLKAEWLTISDIMEELSIRKPNNTAARDIGRALRALGCLESRRLVDGNKQRKYLHPSKDAARS